MRKALLLLAMIMVQMSTLAFAQSGKVAGTVYSEEDGEPIVGATVTVTGTKLSAATDIDGRFTINGLSPSDKTITVNYIGMEPATVPIGPDVKVVLKLKSELMEEVVVVAFGKQKREAFTGSAGVVKADDIAKVQVNDPVSALDGRVSGMQIISSNDPSEEPTITIRGIGSLNAGSSPLIVVDGMPFNGYLRDINPADVDNISVLKDAASNALYGARGANGVILITTKNAQRGNTRVTLDMKWGANTDAKIDYDVIDNPGEYYEAHYLALRNYYKNTLGLSDYDAHLRANSTMDQSSANGGVGYVVYAVPRNQALIGFNGKLNPNATLGNRIAYDGQVYMLTPDNWRKEGLRDGFRQEYNLNITGGGERNSFYASLGYLDNNGISYGSKLERYNAKLKTEFQAYNWMRVGGTASYTHTISDAQNETFEVAHNIAPIYPLYIRDGYGRILSDEHGLRYDYGNGDNAGLVRTVEKNNNSIQNDRLNTNRLTSDAFNIQGFMHIDFLKDFRLTINGSAYLLNVRQSYATNPYYGYAQETGGVVWTSEYRSNTLNFQQLLNWSHQYGLHNVEALIGHEYNRDTTTNLDAMKYQVAIFDQNQELDGAIVNGYINGNKSMYNVEGYFIRAQYDYDSRYFLSGSFRRDGSSRFHPDHRWGNFWSAGGAWILTKEEWFPKLPQINMLKFKVSYGEQGNDNIGDFRYTDCYTIDNSNDEIAFTFSTKGNPNITWETVGALNTGFEFDFFNNRIGGSVEYYNRSTKDMLMVTEVPGSLGYTSYYDNMGNMRNQGCEINLTGSPIRTRDINWTINANITFERNRITKLPADKTLKNIDGHGGYQSGWFFYGEGLPVYTWYMPEYAGVNDQGRSQWVTSKELADRNAAGEPIKNGAGQYVSTEYSNAVYQLAGSALPKAYGGFGTTLTLYGFDITAQFTYSIGGKKLDNGYISLLSAPYSGVTGYNIHRDIWNSWSEGNTSSDMPIWEYGYTSANATSTRFLTDASSLSFRTLNAGYTLPQSFTKRFGVERLRVYFSVDNVAYWTKRQGFDPRTVRHTSSDSDYSPMRTFMGGLNVTL